MKEVMRYPSGVEKDDFKFAATARTELDRSMKASGAKSDLQLATTLKKKTKSLLALDPYMFAEISLFEALCGAGSERRLLSSLLTFFPSPTKSVPAATVAQSLSQMVKTQHYSYSCAPAQNKVQAIIKWTARVVADREPQLNLAQDCDMMAEVAARFQFFLRRSVPTADPPGKKGGKQEMKEVIGAEALADLYDEIREKSDAPKKFPPAELLEFVTPLIVFRYLGDAGLQANIDAVVEKIDAAIGGEISKATGGTASASSTGGAGAGKAGKKATKKQAEEQAGDTDVGKAGKRAMTLFGC